MSWALVALSWAGSAGRVEVVSALDADLPDLRTEGWGVWLVDNGMIEEPRGESAGRGCSTARDRWPLRLVSNLVLAARNWRRR